MDHNHLKVQHPIQCSWPCCHSGGAQCDVPIVNNLVINYLLKHLCVVVFSKILEKGIYIYMHSTYIIFYCILF